METKSLFPRKLSRGVGFPFPMDSDNQNPGFSSGIQGIVPDAIRGIAKKPYRVLTINLSSSRTDQKFDIVGNVIQIVEGYDVANSIPDSSARITIKFNDTGADAVPFYPGQSIGGLPFDTLYISNDAQTDKTISILVITDSANDRVDTE
jgi:hypothetical protein